MSCLPSAGRFRCLLPETHLIYFFFCLRKQGSNIDSWIMDHGSNMKYQLGAMATCDHKCTAIFFYLFIFFFEKGAVVYPSFNFDI